MNESVCVYVRISHRGRVKTVKDAASQRSPSISMLSDNVLKVICKNPSAVEGQDAQGKWLYQLSLGKEDGAEYSSEPRH